MMKKFQEIPYLKSLVKINDIDFEKEYHLILTGIDDPISYEFSTNTIEIYNGEGLRKGRDRINTKTISLDFKYFSNNDSEINELLTNINDVFFDVYGQTKEVKFQLAYWGNVHVKAHLKSQLRPDRVRRNGKISIDLICYNPFKYSNEKYNESLTAGSESITWGSNTITFNDPYTFNYQIVGSGSSIINIPNDGMVVYPKVYISGSADSLVINNRGREIRFTEPFTNSRWEIERFIAYKNGIETYVEAYNFVLFPGENEITINGINVDISVKFEFRNRYR